MSAPARAVVSDFGGVLTNPLIEAFAAYQEHSGVRFEDLGRAMQAATEARGGEHPLFLLEKGLISEDEFLHRLEEQLPEGTRLEGFRDAYFDALHPNEELIGFLRELRERGLRMAMLTNNVREWEPHWRSKLPDIDEIFELVVDSAFVGMRKPEPGIYELTLERLGGGLAAEDCVFLDDLEVNVEAARELGMRAVHYRSNAQAIPAIEDALRA
ncbi:MAG: HAD family phosphatase [Thermoleophilaceae bacterium]